MSRTDDKMARRATHLRHEQILETIGDPESGGGVILCRRRDGRHEAHFYRPREIRHPFLRRTVDSAHARLGLLDALRAEIAADKARKIAPHPLVRGDVMVRIWGATLREAAFLVVSDVPHPRKVRLAPLDRRFTSGDWAAGQVVPILPDPLPDPGVGTVHTVSMATGTPEIRENEICKIHLWTGEPVQVYSD